MSARVPPLIVWFGLLPSLAAQKPPAVDGNERPALRLVHLLDGLRQDAPDHDLARLGELPVAKEAAKVGLDLARPANPLVAHACAKGRLFYVFYKATDDAFGDRVWLIQRIRKVERTWSSADGKPEEKVTWQVEAFKTIAGTLKGTDQHFGSFALRDSHRREITKEYEIGFGEVPGVGEGVAWPFAADTLFHMLQPYAETNGLHEQVKFTKSRRWTLSVSLAKDGTYAIVAPVLGIMVPKQVPDVALARPREDASSKGIVLGPDGPPGVSLGRSSIAEVTKVLGEPLEDVPAGKVGRNVSYRGSLTCNFDGSGKLNTVITRATFAGKTQSGVMHGMTRIAVREKLGAPEKQPDDAPSWNYPGLVVTFDGFGTVSRLVITKP